MNNKELRDYKSYPKGFGNLVKDIDLPIKDTNGRETYIWNLIELLIRN